MTSNLTQFPFGPCPACARAIYVDTDADGQPTGVYHAMPMCERYEAEDASPFLLWVLDCREAERRRGGDA